MSELKERYLQLYRSKCKALQYKIDNEPCKLKAINYRIELFYVIDSISNIEADLMEAKGNKKAISKEQSDLAIDFKAKKYSEIISLIATKVSILNNRIACEPDDLTKVNYELEVESLQAEIAAKKSFLAAWIERKKITS